MVDARIGDWLGRLLLVALLVSAASVGAHAQDKEYQALEKQVRSLYEQGKYDEADRIARRAITISEQRNGPDHLQVAHALNNLALIEGGRGRGSEAEALHKRALAIREKARGPEHADVSNSLNNLGVLYRNLNRFDEAEAMFKRSLAIREKVLGPDHADIGQALNNLASLYRLQGRHKDAEPLVRRGLAIREKAHGPEHAHVAGSLMELAELYQDQDRLGEAEPLIKRALAIREKTLGADSPDVATTVTRLASLYQTLGRISEVEPLLKRGLEIRERTFGANSVQVAGSLVALGELHNTQGRISDAEALFKRALAIREKSLGTEHLSVGYLLDSLGRLYRNQARYADAEPLLKRALMIREKALGSEHASVGHSYNNLAELYRYQRRFADAEDLYMRALAVLEKALGREHRQVAYIRVNLAELYRRQGRLDDAQPLYEQGLKVLESSLQPDHPEVGVALNRLANLYRIRGRLDEAEPLMKRALANREKAYGPDHPGVAYDLNNLALVAFHRRDWSQAADYWRRSTAIVQRRAAGSTASSVEGDGTGTEVQQAHLYFRGLVKAAYRADGERQSTDTPLARETFETAQWVLSSEAAASVALMAARGATNDPGLSSLVRERQDLVAEWRQKDKQLLAAKSMTPEMRKADVETVLADRLMAIDKRFVTIDGQLAKDYPDYAALASTRPISVAEAQVELRGDEALVLFLGVPELKPVGDETFVWVVTRNRVRLVRTALGGSELSREVAALRCGLDGTAWSGAGAERCAALLGIAREKIPAPGTQLPFDAARAHKLYVALFGQVRDLIEGRNLLIVPTGALAQLPFQVLAARPPRGDDMRQVHWLARDHAVTILPAAASMKSLRRIGRPSSAPLPMVGFGNPLLDGPDNRYEELAKLARDTQKCPNTRWRRRSSTVVGLRRGVDQVTTRGGFADPVHLKNQTPLPETADELCAVARDMRADQREMRLGARATEREVKAMSARGDLARYRIVHFATHGTLAGQLQGAPDPGLILTPPARANAEDDGYLSAPEIAGLKLDADWVILSACNTAAGNQGHSEALSGLARAFIYAGARALLVSHWAVDSDATVKLITWAVREMSRDARVGRAEALRRATLALVDNGEAHEAHPAYWAPFVVVGEGAPQS